MIAEIGWWARYLTALKFECRRPVQSENWKHSAVRNGAAIGAGDGFDFA
jgi:hypothetical protein